MFSSLMRQVIDRNRISLVKGLGAAVTSAAAAKAAVIAVRRRERAAAYHSQAVERLQTPPFPAVLSPSVDGGYQSHSGSLLHIKRATRSMMNAYQIQQFGKALVHERLARPVLGRNEVLVRTSVTGVCHTDLHVAKGDLPGVQLPLVPGHEGVGVVEKVGFNVSSLQVGQRVGCPWLGHSCLHCFFCTSGREHLCPNQRQTGLRRNGTFAEYFAVDERFAARIPSKLTDVEAAPVLCAGVTAYKALKIGNFKKGARIVISGAVGGLGHMTVQYAKAMGFEVVALDMFTDAKKAFMTELGADYTVDVADPDTVAENLALQKPFKLLDGAVILAPSAQAVTDATQYCPPGSTIVCVCLPSGAFNVDPMKIVSKELKLQGSIVGTPRDLQEALLLVADGKVHAYTEERRFDEVNEVLDELSRSSIRGRMVLRVSTFASQ